MCEEKKLNIVQLETSYKKISKEIASLNKELKNLNSFLVKLANKKNLDLMSWNYAVEMKDFAKDMKSKEAERIAYIHEDLKRLEMEKQSLLLELDKLKE